MMQGTTDDKNIIIQEPTESQKRLTTLLTSAGENARLAVELDIRQDYNRSIDSYTLAVQALFELLDMEPIEAKKEQLRGKITEYLTRAEEIKQYIEFSKANPTNKVATEQQLYLPSPPPIPLRVQPQATNQVGQAEEGIAQVGEKIGTAFVNGYQKVTELNQQYQVGEKITKAYNDGVAKVTELNQQYQVTDKLRTGVDTLVSFVSNAATGLATSFTATTSNVPPTATTTATVPQVATNTAPVTTPQEPTAQTK